MTCVVYDLSAVVQECLCKAGAYTSFYRNVPSRSSRVGNEKAVGCGLDCTSMRVQEPLGEKREKIKYFKLN